MSKVIIIGGGASGLASAITAAKNNNEVIILERNKFCCKKILSTGNGKCNYWNDDQNKNHYHSTNKELLSEIISKEYEDKIKEFFDFLGIIPIVKEGYYYPYSNQAQSIKEALITQAKLLGVNIKNDEYVKKIEKRNNKFIIETKENKYESEKIILSTGSKAAPKTGSDGNGYELLKKMGHTIINPLPSLVQLRGKENYFKEWSGVRTDVNIKLYENGNLLKEENGEIQLTDYGISGICSMQLSGFIAKGLYNGKKEQVTINFIPKISSNYDDAINWFTTRNKLLKNRTITQLLNSVLNNKLITFLLKKSNIKEYDTWNTTSEDKKKLLINNIINFELEIIGTNSFEQAQTTTGGIPLNEVNIKTMESKIVKSMFIIGELLDVDGDCGGYNLGFAWLSGIIAGENIND